MDTPAERRRVRGATTRHPVFAWCYEHAAPMLEGAGVARHRDELLAGLAGTVIEVGAGSGLSFAHYPRSVTSVLAVEPEPRLRRAASRAARRAPVRVGVVAGLADRLPAATASFDAAVVSLVLCSVADQRAALAEIRRVLRPGAELRFYEHVRADTARAARWQDRADRWWRLIAGGCHPNRDTVSAIETGGFDITSCRRFSFRPGPCATPVAPHVIGRARRPNEDELAAPG